MELVGWLRMGTRGGDVPERHFIWC